MNEGGVGRVLAASLHQGIADILPSRLDFYEEWLNPKAMRDGRIGLAPLAAVLSFLRREGDAYQLVSARAGEYAAQWTFDELTPLRRTIIRAAPQRMRRWLVGRLVRQMVLRTHKHCRATVRWKEGTGTVGLIGSLFCIVREPSNGPLCGYYASAVRRLMELAGINVAVVASSCRAQGAAQCDMSLTVES